MGLSHSGFTFGGSSLHGDVIPMGPYELRLIVEGFFGVAGEAHLIGDIGGRELVCEYTLSGFNTSTLLRTQLDAIDAKIGELTGTLTLTGNITGTFPKCTFLGFERMPMFLDGSGVNGWVCHGRLHWRQRAAA